MRKFSDIITEATGTIVFTFGRFNPPTTGHEKLIKKVASVAGSMPFRIYPSQSNNPKKDPLPFALKVAYMRKMFPRYAKNIKADKNARTAIEIAVKLYKEGFHAINMVVGSDRVKEFQTLLDRYNGVEARHGYYGFDDIRVISAGERDPDAEGVEGMSASKMRAAATAGDFDSFKMGVPSGFKDALKLYNDVRKYMGIREERDMGEMTDFESLRDLYLTGKIWNVGDIVEANGVQGKVIRKGTNYLSFVDEENKVHKAWLYDIVERDYKKEYANYQGTPEQIARRSSRNKARRIMGDKAVKGMDVGHIDNDPMNNDPSNLKNEDPSVNRREPRLREVKQDKEIDDKKGTQPAKYYAGDMAKSTKAKRDAHFKSKKKGPAPGDASATTKPSKHTKKFKQMYGEELINEKKAKQAVSQGKVQKLVTAHGLKYKGKVYKEIDMELKGIDNNTEMVTFNIIHPREIFGNEVKIAFKTLRRGPFMATDTSKINEKLGKDADAGDYIDDFQKSDAPQFKGKSKEKRKDMAIAAYLDKKDKNEEVDMDIYHLDEKIAALVNKAKKTGMPYGILKKVYDRGMAAYKTGHRPGATPQQWALARVNSFTTKSAGTWGKADKDLAAKVRASEEVEVQETELGMIPKKKRKGHEVLGPESVNEWFESNQTRASYQLRHGDDWWWKLNEVHDQMLEKTGACCDDCAEDLEEEVDESLWANIHKKRQRIKGGSGEKMRKKGEKGAPTPAQLKRAKGESIFDYVERRMSTLRKDKDLPNLKIPKKGKAGVTKFQRKSGNVTRPDSPYRMMMKNSWGEVTEAAEYQGRKVQLNNPTKGDVKKYKVYVKNDKGNVVKVEFGDPNMSIKRDDPERRKAFRARHGCDTDPGPKYKAKYWSCKFWSSKSVTDLMKG